MMTKVHREKFPWEEPPLHDWAIVGMNHYFVKGTKHLFVAMVRGERCIKAEGMDERDVFAKLAELARQAD